MVGSLEFNFFDYKCSPISLVTFLPYIFQMGLDFSIYCLLPKLKRIDLSMNNDLSEHWEKDSVYTLLMDILRTFDFDLSS